MISTMRPISFVHGLVRGLVGSAIVVLVVACRGGSGSPDEAGSASSGRATGAAPPGEVRSGEEIKVAPPSTKLEVTGSIISATLGDDCGASGAKLAPSGDCAPGVDGTGCGFACQQSNMQLSFKTGTGQAAKVTISSVALLDAKTGAEVDELLAREPQIWNGTTYADWDQTLAPATEHRVSYDLSAPKWGTGDVGAKYSSQYRIKVTLEIDGVEVVLESEALNREPNVAT